jgi:hypothetical protein
MVLEKISSVKLLLKISVKVCESLFEEFLQQLQQFKLKYVMVELKFLEDSIKKELKKQQKN